MGKVRIERQGSGVEREGHASRSALQLAVLERDTEWIQRLPADGEVVIGRSSDSDVQVRDPGVSRRHAVLHVGSEIRVECVSRTNRVLVGRVGDGSTRASPAPSWRKIEGSCTVSPGDAILVGSSMIVIRKAPTTGPIDMGAPTQTLDCVTVPHDPGELHVPPGLLPLFAQAQRVAKSGLNVVIVGEPGVGKSVLAGAIHLGSRRADRPFTTVSCGALSGGLLESALFGHEKGVFPEALVAEPGAFELADGGTVVLDDVDALDPLLQGRLQIALLERKIYRMGGGTPHTIDVRMIATAQSDLEEAVERGAFRRDLFDLLNEAPFVITPLRDRVGDIAPLAHAFLQEASAALGDASCPTISAEALSLLERHPWRGNGRELRNVLEMALTRCDDHELRPEHLHLSTEEETRESGEHLVRPRPQGRLLPLAIVDQLYAAAIEAGLPPLPLRQGINHEFAATIDDREDHALQLKEDLAQMNEAGQLMDGTVPLLTWLKNAIDAAGQKTERKVFLDAYHELAAARRG